MINVHLNGDVVRCPDISILLTRANEIKDSHRICKYNYHEDSCDAWQSHYKSWDNIKKNDCSGRCSLSGSIICPGHVKKKELGNQIKKFSINNQVYRKVASTAHYLVKESKNKTLFITLTFPQFKKKVTYNEINNYFSKYIENLRKNYDCGGYVAVREFGKKSHRVHFHLLLSIPFVDFSTLNDSWCHCIKDICAYSRNALTTDKKTLFIRNPTRALRYVCKYFSKGRGQSSSSRLVFISNNLLSHKEKDQNVSNIKKSIVGNVESLFKGYKSIYINQTSDYSTCFRVTDPKEFDRFCNNFIYPFFELSDKKPENLYSFPVNSS